MGTAAFSAMDGQCKAFDAAADGFGRGEGIGVVVLKRRSQAVADGDSILAVIRAVSVNQDGRSSSLTAPNGMAQSALIRQALDRCRLAPRDIDYVEAHGTGTALGDPIEIHALKDVFAPSRDAGRPLRVGAVKSNVAHLEAAAGMAGLIKTVLALNHGELPPNIHFDRLNPHISTDGFPVVFPQRVEPWPDRNDAPRRAGVSSFGFSGTNAHVILEASPQATSAVVEPPAGPFLLVLSAASEASARRLASLLSDRVVTAGASELRDIACTLIGNRSQLDWRIAVIAQHADDAARRLREAVPVQAETAHRNPFVFTGSMDCERARQHFLSGVPLEMGGDVSYRRARLPLYPFDRKPYWFEASRPKAIQPAPDGEHPLLGRRCRSPGAERRYESTLHPARHPWFADHAVDGRAAMPAAAIIGMFQHAAGDGAVLNDVRFQTLLHVDEPVVLSTVVSDGRITLHSSPLETDDWSLVAEASLARRDHDAPAPNALETGNAGEAVTDLDGYYDLFSRQGLRYGEGFRTIVALHGGPGHARARLALPGGSDHVRGHFVHPALLDGAFQSLAAAAAGLDLAGSGFRPAAVRSVTLRGPAGNEAVSFATVRTGDDGALIADLEIETPDGQPLASIAGLELRPTQRDDEGFATIADVSWERYVPAAGRFPGETVIVHAGSRSIASAVIDVLDALRPLLHDGDPRRIAVATRLAASLPGDIHSPDIAGAAVHGLCASLMQEYPRALIVVIDLDHQDGGVEIELPSESGFYALRNGGIFTRRLVPREAWSGEAVTLRRPEDGRLAELNYAPQRMQQPGPGQVLLSVAVSGLNFRDVMNALGTYPGDAGKLGGEMAGFVLAVGEGVAGLVPGDKVMAIAPGSHASHVVADARLVWPLPRDWSLAQAATAPTVYLTAAALRTMGEIGPDKTILIHAGTGGVGLAAIAIARAAGARIIATAGTEAKRNALRDIGLTSVSDSRSLRFVEDVQQATGGEGVDIVLNSLSGALIAAGFDVLKPGGVFLEMGRAGVWDDATAQAYRPDVRYTRISLDDDIFNAPRKVAETWRELQRDIAAGLLPPLPVKLFPATDAAQAFAYMRDARHIGRIGLNRQLLDSSSAYLVTGGTGALGLAAAARLVELGATQVTLAGRGGRSPDPDRLAKLRHMGADIQVRMVDMTDRTAVEALLQSFDRPLRGIIHAAGVLDDGTAQTLTDHQIRAVLDAKLSSALHLDRASRSHPLDFFVLFSSAAGVLGSAGQANYASANAGLDALAAKRRSDGLPAVSIAWGAWNQGMASKLRGPRLSEAAGLMILERVLQGETPHIIAMPGRARVAGAEAQALADASATLRGRLLAAADAERYGIMRDAIRALVSTDMAIPETELASRRPLHDYGLDSLLAVELRNGLAALASKTMPASLLFDYPTIDALAGFLLERMIEAPPRSPVTGSAPAVTPPTVDSVDAARQLMQELELAGY